MVNNRKTWSTTAIDEVGIDVGVVGVPSRDASAVAVAANAGAGCCDDFFVIVVSCIFCCWWRMRKKMWPVLDDVGSLNSDGVQLCGCVDGE